MTDVSPAVAGPRLASVLRADAVWDGLLGIGLLLAPWPAVAHAVGTAPARPWPVFVLIGLGCLAFAVVMARVAGGPGAVGVARAAALANGAGVVAAVVLLLFVAPDLTTRAALVVAAVGCAVFAALEWRRG